jgi:hypothetical protein
VLFVRVAKQSLVMGPSSSEADEKANKEAANDQKAEEGTDGHGGYVCCFGLYRGALWTLSRRIGMRNF